MAKDQTPQNKPKVEMCPQAIQSHNALRAAISHALLKGAFDLEEIEQVTEHLRILAGFIMYSDGPQGQWPDFSKRL